MNTYDTRDQPIPGLGLWICGGCNYTTNYDRRALLHHVSTGHAIEGER